MLYPRDNESAKDLKKWLIFIIIFSIIAIIIICFFAYYKNNSDTERLNSSFYNYLELHQSNKDINSKIPNWGKFNKNYLQLKAAQSAAFFLTKI